MPEGILRGDECFRQRYGDNVSLLDAEGDINTRFALNPSLCHPTLSGTALLLAGLMRARNCAVTDVNNAKRQLDKVETALKDATRGGDANAMAEATRMRELQKEVWVFEKKVLKSAQEKLVEEHETAVELTRKSDDMLAASKNWVAEVRAYRNQITEMPRSYIGLEPTALLLVACATVGGMVASQIRPLESLVETLRRELGSSSAAVLGSILEAAGYAASDTETSSASSNVHLLRSAGLGVDAQEIIEVSFGLVVGLIFAYGLVAMRRV